MPRHSPYPDTKMVNTRNSLNTGAKTANFDGELRGAKWGFAHLKEAGYNDSEEKK
jgi:hypothetical protein